MDKITEQKEQQNIDTDKQTLSSKESTQQSNSRRRILQALTVGGVASSSQFLPEQWSKPVVNSLMLPAHATTTDTTGASSGGQTTTPAPVVMIGQISGFAIRRSASQPAEALPQNMASTGKSVLDFIVPQAAAQAINPPSDAAEQCITVTASVENGPVTVEISNVGTQNATLSGRNFSVVFPHTAGDFPVTGTINAAFTEASGTVKDDGDASCSSTFTAVVGGTCTPGQPEAYDNFYCSSPG